MLFRRDIILMGGGVNAITKRKSGIISNVYDSELYLLNKTFPCIVTFYKLFGAYKINIINDKLDEKVVYDYYFDFLRDRPRFLFEYVARHFIGVISSLAMICCIIFSILETYKGIYNMHWFIIFFLLYLVKFIISLV